MNEPTTPMLPEAPRRAYHRWVATETMEDFALRFTPRRARRYGEWTVANTAFGASSFLVLEAIGADLLLHIGFAHSVWSILITGVLIALLGLPICVFAARHGVDMDLLTRGAGFGYVGSTVTSLVYAAFTFLLFALEAAVMASAIHMALGLPLSLAYVVCALLVIPLVLNGMRSITRLQAWTLPIWITLWAAPFVALAVQRPHLLAQAWQGGAGETAGPWLTDVGTGVTVGIALITQIAEQVDYLRFMPERHAANRQRWWAAVLVGGPGWVIPGVFKMMGGALLAWWALHTGMSSAQALDPNRLYLGAFTQWLHAPTLALWLTAIFVLISQIKINVTNAYAGSLAWSNFFSRLTHSHPGRVVWLVFNVAIALMLMEMDLFDAMHRVLSIYACLALSWMGAVVADLVVNKPLGWSPPGLEFRRAMLYDVNPVGVGALISGTLAASLAALGDLGATARHFPPLIALVAAMLTSPLLARLTRGRWYLRDAWPQPTPAQGGALAPTVSQAEPADPAASQPAWPEPAAATSQLSCTLGQGRPGCTKRCGLGRTELGQIQATSSPQVAVEPMPFLAGARGAHTSAHTSTAPTSSALSSVTTHSCVMCQQSYEAEDMAACPAYGGMICSLCCALDSRCGDLCRPQARWSAQWQHACLAVLPQRWSVLVHNGFADFVLIFGVLSAVLLALAALYMNQLNSLLGGLDSDAEGIRHSVYGVGSVLWLVMAILCWWLVLSARSRDAAQQESNLQTQRLSAEVQSHRVTDAKLQLAREQAEAANRAKSRYIVSVSHELRTPLNSLLGYAQLLAEDPDIPSHRRRAVAVMREAGDHLLGVIDHTLDIARIESGRLSLVPAPMDFQLFVQQLVQLFEMQAVDKGLEFRFEPEGRLPERVRADAKRLRQVLINLLGNAIKFTQRGHVSLGLRHERDMLWATIADSGPGIAAADQARIFEPFEQGGDRPSLAAGAGVGLTIARMLSDLMGGQLRLLSSSHEGSVFVLQLFLPELPSSPLPQEALAQAICGYRGPRRRVLVVDDEPHDRELLAHWLSSLGFLQATTANPHQALALMESFQPDVVLADLDLPGMSGWELLQRLRQGPHVATPVAIISAHDPDLGSAELLSLGADCYLTKPLRLLQLQSWLGDQLQLQWVPRPAPLGAGPAPPLAQVSLDDSDRPSAQACTALKQALAQGYLRGVRSELARLRAAHPHWQAWLAQVQEMADAFQLERLRQALDQLPHIPELRT